MEEREDTTPGIPTHGSSPLRFIPFTDNATGRLTWPLPAPETIDVETGKQLLLMASAEIIAIVAESNYVNIYTTVEGERMRYRKTLVHNCLKYYDQWLFRYGFLRVHESFIINIRHLMGKNGNKLLLSRSLGIDVQIGKTYKKLVKKAFSIFRQP